MDRRLVRLAQSKRRMRRLCSVCRVLFSALLAIYICVIGAVFFYAVGHPGDFAYVGPWDAPELIAITCDAVSGGLALFLLAKMMSSVSRGDSPITRGFANLMIALGAVLALGVIAQLLVAPGTAVGAIDGESFVGLEYGGQREDSLNINVRGAIESIGCFAFAAVLRYASLIQMEADDLV